jgi:hypothetical protein
LNFQEYTFLPCREFPNHESSDFQKSMRWYYPFKPEELRRVNAWKRQAEGVNLHETGGHHVGFPNQKIGTEIGIMRHYLFLSPDHAREKYGLRGYDPIEMAKDWHGWRSDIQKDTQITLPSTDEMNLWELGKLLAMDNPRDEHYSFLADDETSQQ